MTAHATAATPLRPLDLLDLDDDLAPEELEVRERVASWAAERVAPRIAELFDRGEWDRSLAREMGELGVLGMHLEGHGCPGGSAVQYGLACAELEAVDGGRRGDRLLRAHGADRGLGPVAHAYDGAPRRRRLDPRREQALDRHGVDRG